MTSSLLHKLVVSEEMVHVKALHLCLQKYEECPNSHFYKHGCGDAMQKNTSG